jgi:putative hemolysin
MILPEGRVLLLIAGILLVALLTAGGMAVRSVSRIWLRHWAERRLRGADAALAFLERPHRLVAASSVAIALVVVLLGVLLGEWRAEGTPAWRFTLIIASVALALVLVGQIAARAIARRWAAKVVPVTLPLLQLAQLVALPVLALGRLIARPAVATTRRADGAGARLVAGSVARGRAGRRGRA